MDSYHKGFSRIILLIVFIVGLITAVVLVGQKTYFSPKATAPALTRSGMLTVIGTTQGGNGSDRYDARYDYDKDGNITVADYNTLISLNQITDDNTAQPPAPAVTQAPAITSSPPAASFKRVFITSTAYNGNLGGLTGADAKCQTRANAASLGGTWKAWLSDNSTSARDRLAHSVLPYKLLTNDTVADNWIGLSSESIRHPINRDEFGHTLDDTSNPDRTYSGHVFAWTNTIANGIGIAYSCSNWTYDGNSTGCVGMATIEGHPRGTYITNRSWSCLYTNEACSNTNRLYCIEQ